MNHFRQNNLGVSTVKWGQSLVLFLLLFQGVAGAVNLPNIGPMVKKIEVINEQSVKGTITIAQDSSGFLWLGTTTGLLRFDGYTTKLYEHNSNDANSLAHNVVTSIVEDEQGYLWLLTAGGLSRFDPRTEQFLNFFHDKQNANTLDSNKLMSISVGKDQVLWIGSMAGINRFDTKTLSNQRLNTQLEPANGEDPVMINAIVEDKQQRLWFAAKNRGLSMRASSQDSIVHFKHDSNDVNTLDSNAVISILETSNGDIWTTTIKGANLFVGQSQHFKRYELPIKSINQTGQVEAKDIFEDAKGRLWVATDFNGISVLIPGSDAFVEVNQGPDGNGNLNFSRFRQVFEDNSGALWFVTSNAGLYKLTASSLLFEHFSTAGQASAYLLSTYTDKRGTLWLGAGQDLYRYDQNTSAFISEVKGIGFITAIAEDANQALVFNVDHKGVYSYDLNLKQLSPFGEFEGATPKLHSTNLHSLDIDNEGTLWLGFYGSKKGGAGVYSFDPQNHQYVRHLDTYTIESILALDGYVLAGTRGNGLRVLDKNTGVWFELKNERHDSSIIWALYQDSKGRIWAATDDAGLAQVDLLSKTLTYTDVTDGMPINRIKSIVEQGSGALWLGTGKGIVRFDPDSGQVNMLGRSDGLRIEDITPEMAAVAANGDIVMGNYTSLVRFSPEKVTAKLNERGTESTILLSDFKLFNQSVPFKTDTNNSPLKQTINSLSDLTLTYQDYWFSVAFSSSNYNESGNIRFAYKLEGLNDHWVEADNNNLIATFTSLPANDYTLKIKTGYKGGDWHNNIRSLDITVTPPIWKTWQAYLFYVFAIVMSLYSFYRFRTKALVQRANELEQGVIERTATINRLMSQKERMFANISHEFKTPLTLILNPLESISQSQTVADFGRKVSMMKRNGQRLLRMVEQLLELSKLETTDTDKRHNYSLFETLEMLLTSFQPLFDSKNLTLHHEPFEDVVLSLKADSLEMILTNLISNAIKYTKADGSIVVTVTEEPGQVVIVVGDTGIGIDAENQKIVFNRFTRANEKHDENIPGAGIGLALVKELVEANDGKITLTSEIGKGSQFTVVLPLSKTRSEAVQKIISLSTSSQTEIKSLAYPQNELVNVAVEYTEAVADEVSTSRPTLLLIDDNPDMLELLKDTLGEKYHCISENNGENGVTAAKEHLPDLVISDVMMPGISGFDVLKQLKEDDLTGHIPVVLLTAKGDIQSRIRGWSEKADEYLEKPFNSVELLIRIESLLSIRALLRHRYQREFTEPTKLVVQKTDEGRVESTQIKATSASAQAPLLNPQSALQSAQAELEQSKSINSVNQVFFERINKVLEKHYSKESLDVAFLASELAMSHRQLGRKMKSLLDLTPAESIRSFRLKKAAEQLNQGVSPGVVAHQVGFTSHSYFSQCFKAQFDCLPSNYN